MLVCKFYAQGNCRFGDSCKFAHLGAVGGGGGEASILRAQATASGPGVDVNTLVKSVSNDMVAAERGGQWLLSCYAPFKDKPALPGFEDQSFEEVRLGFYEAQRNGTTEQFKRHLQSVLQGVVPKIKALQNPAQDTVALLKQIYDSPPLSSANAPISGVQNMQTEQQQSIFAGKSPLLAAQASIFTNNSQTGFASGPIFGGKTQNTGNIFGNNQQKSIFGGGQANTGSGSVFATAASPLQSSGSIFGGQQQQASVFGQQGVQSAAASSIFSGGGSGSVFGGAPQQTQQGNSVFMQTSMQQANVSPFFTSQNQQQQPPPSSQNIFATQQQQQQQQQQQLRPSNASIFGGAGVAQTQNPSNIDETAYSKLEDLSEDDKRSFEAAEFEFGKIPETPPAQNMCR